MTITDKLELLASKMDKNAQYRTPMSWDNFQYVDMFMLRGWIEASKRNDDMYNWVHVYEKCNKVWEILNND